MNQNFSHAVRMVLTVAHGEIHGLAIGRDELLNCGYVPPANTLHILERLMLAGLIEPRNDRFALCRAPAEIRLAEVYEATWEGPAVSDTFFGEVFQKLASKIQIAIEEEFGAVSVEACVADLIPQEDIRPHFIGKRQ